MTRLFIVRHGESEGNDRNEYHGQYDSDLTERGHREAACTAEYLDGFGIDAIYSSDLRRAYFTAKHTADRRGLRVIPEPGLREIYGGRWQRMTFDEISAQYPDEYRIWREDISRCRCPEGESVEEVALRIRSALARIAAENDGKNLLVVTHAVPIRAMRCVWLGLPLSEMRNVRWVANASVTAVDYDNRGGYDVVMYGEAAHLSRAGLLTELPKKI